MKMKLLINTRVIDPQNNIDEVGGILIDENGKIKAVGKKVTKDNAPKDCEIIDCKGNISIPGLSTCEYLSENLALNTKKILEL